MTAPPGATLRVALGQCSAAGPKPVNQDFHGAVVPAGAALATKGIALALADGIGSSECSQLASAAAVRGARSLSSRIGRMTSRRSQPRGPQTR